MRWSSLARRAACAAALLLPSLGSFAATPLQKTVLDLLGTTCTVRAYTGGSAEALDAAFARLAEIDTRMSVTGAASELAAVNAAAGVRAVKVTSDLIAVAKLGLLYSRQGNGAFDLTVEPLVRLWGIGTAAQRVPSASEIKAVLPLISWKDVVVDEKASTLSLKRKGMGIDLGSVAKGYAADEAARILAEHGVTASLIDLGGNILATGKKPDGSKWRIAIQNPEEARGTALGYVDITSGSVTTAGTYERFFEKDGKRYFHILDARTGYPAWNGLLAAAIIAPDSATADGYDTLVFTLGLEKGMQLVESTKGLVEAVFVTDKRTVYVTPGLVGRFTLTDLRFTLGK